MKVLVITAWKPRKGGIVTHVENLTRRSENEFRLLTYKDKGTLDSENVLRVPYINFPVLRGLSFALFAFFKARNLEFDVIHAHYALPQGFTGLLLKWVKKKPLVLTVHGSDLTILGGSAPVRPVLKWVLGGADRIIAVSSYMKGLLMTLGVAGERIRVIHNGVNEQKPADGVEKQILFIGALVRQKGVDILIKAFPEIRGRHPEWNLVIVGDGPERQGLEELASRLELSGGVVFKGYVDDMDSVYTAASILVLPSRQEGFGITLLEAMARGVPVVASNVGGIPEIIVDGENGLLFKAENPKSLADAVSKIIDDTKLKKRFIAGGLETVKRFSWERTAKETDNVYKELG